MIKYFIKLNIIVTLKKKIRIFSKTFDQLMCWAMVAMVIASHIKRNVILPSVTLSLTIFKIDSLDYYLLMPLSPNNYYQTETYIKCFLLIYTFCVCEFMQCCWFGCFSPANVQHWLASYLAFCTSSLCGVQGKQEADSFSQIMHNMALLRWSLYSGEAGKVETTSCCMNSWKHLGEFTLSRAVDMNNECQTFWLLFSMI